MIALDGVSLGYGGPPVLRDLRLAIRPGERVAVLGKSGIGKSTLIRHLYGLWPRDAALIAQDGGLVPPLSVFHNIYMGRLDRHGSVANLATLIWPRARDRRAIGELAARVGLEGELFSPVERLSGGQRQRTAVARALYRGGAMLLADEPVSAVDQLQAATILDQLCAQFATVVVALHDVALALAWTTRVIGLADGRIAFDRPTAGLDRAALAPLYAA